MDAVLGRVVRQVEVSEEPGLGEQIVAVVLASSGCVRVQVPGDGADDNAFSTDGEALEAGLDCISADGLVDDVGTGLAKGGLEFLAEVLGAVVDGYFTADFLELGSIKRHGAIAFDIKQRRRFGWIGFPSIRASKSAAGLHPHKLPWRRSSRFR
jgi:hypothetical protein